MMILIFIIFFINVFAVRSEFDLKPPVLPTRFTTDVEAIFYSDAKVMDAKLHFDKDNNRMALDVLNEGVRTVNIYNYDDDQMFSIEGTTCTSSPIDDENSFFPYTTDPITKKKIMATADQSFYLDKWSSGSEEINSTLPMLLFKTDKTLVHEYKRECEVYHRFTKPEVTTANCGIETCNATLYSITVVCDTADGGVYHEYRFFRFQGIQDERVFQVPQGIHCNAKGGKQFPSMPTYFAFSYDQTEEWITDNSAREFDIQYREVVYDLDYQLIRLNNFNANGVTSFQIYDFRDGVGYSITPSMNACAVGPAGNSDAKSLTMLPKNLFLDDTSKERDSTSYVGVRNQLGLPYDVWTEYLKQKEFQVVTEMYFRKNFEEEGKFVLSHIVEYSYDVDEEDNMEIDKITLFPIRKFRTSPRDLTLFNISMCYKDNGFKAFELKLKVECKENTQKCPDNTFRKGSSVYNQMMESLYEKLSRISGLSPIRISSLEVISLSKETIIRGLLLESPTTLSNKIIAEKSELKLTASEAFENIKNDVTNKGFNFFFFSHDEGMDIRYEATSFVKYSSETIPSGTVQPATYTSGAMAGIGIVMTIVGLVLGAIGLFVFIKSRNGRLPFSSPT